MVRVIASWGQESRRNVKRALTQVSKARNAAADALRDVKPDPEKESAVPDAVFAALNPPFMYYQTTVTTLCGLLDIAIPSPLEKTMPIDDLPQYIARLIQATQAGTIQWDRVNPTTYSYQSGDARLSLQKLPPPRRVRVDHSPMLHPRLLSRPMRSRLQPPRPVRFSLRQRAGHARNRSPFGPVPSSRGHTHQTRH